MIGQLKRVIELKELQENRTVEDKKNIITFTSGKGGVGKTVISLNSAFSLSKMGYKVLFVDLDLNFSNATILLNTTANKNLFHFLSGKNLVKHIIKKIDDNFYLLPGYSGVINEEYYTNNYLSSLITELKRTANEYDFLFIDTGQIVNLQQLDILLNSYLNVILLTPEPTAVMDAYAILKMLKQKNFCNDKIVLVNKCEHKEEAVDTFSNLNNASLHFLKEKLNFAGFISSDPNIHSSILQQSLFMKNYIHSVAYTQIIALNKKLIDFIQVANITQ